MFPGRAGFAGINSPIGSVISCLMSLSLLLWKNKEILSRHKCHSASSDAASISDGIFVFGGSWFSCNKWLPGTSRQWNMLTRRWRLRWRWRRRRWWGRRRWTRRDVLSRDTYAQEDTQHTHTSPQGLEDKSSGCEHNGSWQRGVARRKEDIAPTSTFLDTTSTSDFEEW